MPLIVFTSKGKERQQNREMSGGSESQFKADWELEFQEFPLIHFHISLWSTDKHLFSTQPHTSDCILLGISHNTFIKAE